MPVPERMCYTTYDDNRHMICLSFTMNELPVNVLTCICIVEDVLFVCFRFLSFILN